MPNNTKQDTQTPESLTSLQHTDESLIERDGWDAYFLDTAIGSVKMLDVLRERSITTGDFDKEKIRMFNYWKQRGVFPNKKESHKWAKWNSYDIAWCGIVEELRDYGLPYEKIAQVKECVFDAFLTNRDNLTIHEYGFLRTLLRSDEPTFLVVLPDGTADVMSEADLLLMHKSKSYTSMIQIDLNILYGRNAKKHHKFWEAKNNLKTLTQREQPIVDAIRTCEGMRQMTIKMKNGEPQLFETTVHVDASKSQKVSDYLKEHEHGSVDFYQQGKGRVQAKVTKREKF